MLFLGRSIKPRFQRSAQFRHHVVPRRTPKGCPAAASPTSHPTHPSTILARRQLKVSLTPPTHQCIAPVPPPGKLLDTSDKSAAGPLEKRDLHIPRRRNCYKLCRFRVRRRFITWSGFFTTKKKPRVPNEISSSASTSDMAFKVGHILTVPHEKNYVGLNSENINYQLKIKLSLPV